MGIPRGQGLAVFTETRREMNQPEVLLRSWCASQSPTPRKGVLAEGPSGFFWIAATLLKEVGRRALKDKSTQIG